MTIVNMEDGGDCEVAGLRESRGRLCSRLELIMLTPLALLDPVLRKCYSITDSEPCSDGIDCCRVCIQLPEIQGSYRGEAIGYFVWCLTCGCRN